MGIGGRSAAAAVFYQQLRVLLAAGFVVDQAVERAGAVAPAPYRRMARLVATSVATGTSLAEALRSAGETALLIALVDAGERCGRLEAVCGEIADHAGQVAAMRRLALARTLYPLLLLHLAAIVPTLPAVVTGQQGPLWLMAGPLSIWLLGLCCWGLLLLLRRCGLSDRLSLYGPLAALDAWRHAAGTCLVLRAAAGAGLHWPEGLRLAAEASGNRLRGHSLRQAADRLEQGADDGLVGALRQARLPPEILALCDSAERAGALEDCLQRCAALARERFQSRLELAVRLAAGTLYALAMAVAVVVILRMASTFYLQPLRELLDAG